MRRRCRYPLTLFVLAPSSESCRSARADSSGSRRGRTPVRCRDQRCSVAVSHIAPEICLWLTGRRRPLPAADRQGGHQSRSELNCFHSSRHFSRTLGQKIRGCPASQPRNVPAPSPTSMTWPACLHHGLRTQPALLVCRGRRQGRRAGMHGA